MKKQENPLDQNTKVILLLVAGGVGVYLIYKSGVLAQWFPSVFGPATTPATTPAGGTPTSGGANTGGSTPSGPPPPGSNAPATGTTFTDGAGNTYTWTGSAWSVSSCVSGYTVQGNKCVPVPAGGGGSGAGSGSGSGNGGGGAGASNTAAATSSLVQAAAQSAGAGDVLNADQWCYYYTQVSGNPCPIDPGAVDPGTYAAATGQSGADRTTPMNVTQWLAIMQTANPSLTGLSGGMGLVC